MESTGRMGTGIILALMLSVLAATAADLARGKARHDEHCLTCHNSQLYTRPNRRVKNHAMLRKRVAYCANDIGEEWSGDQIDDVTAYLNESFYRFKPE